MYGRFELNMRFIRDSTIECLRRLICLRTWSIHFFLITICKVGLGDEIVSDENISVIPEKSRSLAILIAVPLVRFSMKLFDYLPR